MYSVQASTSTFPCLPSLHTNQLSYYNQTSILQLLQDQSLNPQSHLSTVVFGKALNEKITYQEVKAVLFLYERDGNQWLKVIDRFAKVEYETVFACCIGMNDFSILECLIRQLQKGFPDHRKALQNKIEQLLDLTNEQFSIEVWRLYMSYLKQWVDNHSEFVWKILQKIQSRLCFEYNCQDSGLNDGQVVKKDVFFYSSIKEDSEKRRFLTQLIKMIQIEEQTNLRRLSLLKLYQSLQCTMEYLTQQLSTNGLLCKSILEVCALRESSLQIHESASQNAQRSNQIQQILAFVLLILDTSALTSIFFENRKILFEQLSQFQIIDYRSYSADEDSLRDLMRLESSLTYHIGGDDISSLMEQILSKLPKVLPGFISTFLEDCLLQLSPENFPFNSNQTVMPEKVSDLVLKLGILSKEIIQKELFSDQIRNLIDKIWSQTKQMTEVIGIKIIQLMHFFREILPETYYLNYHEMIFNLLKKSKYCSKNNTQMNICYLEAIKILEDEVQEDSETTKGNLNEKRLRRRKVCDQQRTSELTKSHIHLITDRVLEVIEQKTDFTLQMYQILMSILSNYISVKERNGFYIIKFMTEAIISIFNSTPNSNSSYSQQILNKSIQCLCQVLHAVSEDNYIEIQDNVSLIIERLICDPKYQVFTDQVFELILSLIRASQQITYQTSKCMVLLRHLFNRGQFHNSSVCQILEEMSKSAIVRNVCSDQQELIKFWVHEIARYIQSVRVDELYLMEKDAWAKRAKHIQLFLQSYEEYISNQSDLQACLQQIVNDLNSFHRSTEGDCQLILSLIHIMPSLNVDLPAILKAFITIPFNEVETFKLATLAYADKVMWLLRNQKDSADLVEELTGLCGNLRKMQKQGSLSLRKQFKFSFSMPFNRISHQNYLSDCLSRLHKQKTIDVVEYQAIKHQLLISP